MNKILRLSISIVMVLAMSDQGIARTRSAIVSSGSSADEKAIDLLFAAWNSRDADKFAAAFSEDAVYEDIAAGYVARGKNEIRKWAAGAFTDIADFKIEVKNRSFYRGGGVVEWVWSGMDKGLFKTGKSFSVRGASVIQVRGGKISGYKEYYDFATVMRQLGLLPSENE
jgi:steroid delta-isomerase-like uncharacterized protein